MLWGRMATFMPVLRWTWRGRWLRAPRPGRRYGSRAGARVGRRACATRPGRARHAPPGARRIAHPGRVGEAKRGASCDAFERGRPHEGVVDGGWDAGRVVAAEV